jgi:hypothetical protein
MDEQQTCGKGLAEHSPLPAALAELTAALGRILELHMEALDPGHPAAKPEYEAYERLVTEHRATTDALRAIAGRMAVYVDLQEAPHDMTAMADPRHADAFKRFIEAEEALLALLQTRLGQDIAMLNEMRAQS